MTRMCFYKHIGKSIYYKAVQASIHISVGLSALLGFILSGAMRRPLHRGTGHRAGSTFFVCMGIEPNTIKSVKGAVGRLFEIYEKICNCLSYIAHPFLGFCSDYKGEESVLFGLFLFDGVK